MTSKVTKGRLMLIALVCMFALPAVIAKVILTQGWYQSGVTNRGVLVEPYTTLELLGQESPLKEHRWQLAYVLPNECTEQCRQQLYLLQQSHVALGKYQERVVPVLWQTELSGTVDVSMTTMQMNQSVTAKVKPGQMLIVDPLGQLVMSYSPKPNEDLVSFNKGMLADLRKLLKLSRVG
ncbi:cytochrome oxidase biogenesis cluster protein [Vibrio diabolicus]|uniref:cytochrome oxidase biogenesis cluster protein n=1 Tax=Vibrio diabolicus subgroup TaxID=2315253 RepID=UPI000940D64F|nr:MULTISPECIES: cytochrome oxidase biogenesis cluster protein [Vibrio diabolicus subgroup]MCR9470901.1 cytochrome oxidase biogenesis cluster protein [Vibrio diabolicus]MCS0326964.1 cytochrome oxidase biogenesis cluster protein [Vibrio diabolicus]OKQ17854.1 cytochrome oxidase biogenesis cluster protein [Vibrio antiquarius]